MRVPTLHRKIVDDASAIHGVVDTVFPAKLPVQYEQTPVSIQRFVNRLNVVTEPLGLFSETLNDKEVSPGLIHNSGLWLPKCELPENDSAADLRVLWHLNPKTKRVTMTQHEWGRRRYMFWHMIFHELIHRHQDTYQARDVLVYRTRTDRRDTKEAQAYFGRYDEIETHSHAAAMELFIWWGHLTLKQAMFEATTYSGRAAEPTLQQYEIAFEDAPGHPAMRTFKRKLRAWYEVIKSHPDLYLTLDLSNLVTS